MKFLSMHVRDFLSYRDETIDFSVLDYCSISGSNGAGKSSLPDALEWIIYGSLRVAGDADSVVNDFATEAFGSLVIGESDGTPKWKIERKRSSRTSSGKLALFYHESDEGWKSWGDHRNATPQEQIQSIIGLDRDAFCSLVIMKSSAGTKFTQAQGTERRNILLSLIPEMNHWSEKEKIAKAQLAALEPEISTLESAIERYEEMAERGDERKRDMLRELDDLGDVEDLDELEDRISRVSAKLAKASSGKSDVLAEYEAAESDHEHKLDKADAEEERADRALKAALAHRKRYERTVEKLEQRREELNEKKFALKELGDSAEIEKRIEVSTERVSHFEKLMDEQNSRIKLAKHVIGEHSERIDILEDSDASCYVCQTDLPEDKAEQLISTAKNEKKLQQREMKDAEEKLGKLEDKIATEEDKLDQARRELDKYRTSSARLESAVASAQNAVNEAQDDVDHESKELATEMDIEDLREELKRKEEAVDEIRTQWNIHAKPALDKRLAATESEFVDELTEELGDLKESRIFAQKKQAKINSIEGAIAESTSTVKELELKAVKTRNRLTEVTRRVEDVKYLVAACSPRGIPSMLLDSILGEIEDKQNEILAQLPGTEGMQVEFRQSRANKKGTGSRDTLDIIVHTATGQERRFESFSAGEKVKLTISNLFAMIGVFNQRHPGMIETLFLDEPLGVLDSESVPAFVDVLRVIMSAGIVSSIFVIAHDDRVIEALPQRLIVSRTDNEGSKVMLLS